MLTNTSATLYNCYKNAITNKEEFKRTVLDPIHWEDNEASNIVSSGLTNANRTDIVIWFNNSASGKQYIEPKRYQELTPDKIERYFTFTKGKDKIVKGIVEDTTLTINEIINKYDSTITIKSVDTMDYGRPRMHHWEISGS